MRSSIVQLRGLVKLIKMVALDLDNTLLNSQKQISPRNTRDLRKLHQQGVKIVLCTGRPINAIWPYIEQLGLTKPGDYTITYNGGLVVNNQSKAVLSHLDFSLSDLQPLFKYFHDHDLPLDLLDFDRVYEITDEPRSIYKTVVKNIEFVDRSFAKLPNHPYAKAVLATDPPVVLKVKNNLPASIKKAYHVVQSQAMILEFLPRQVNKAAGLKPLLAHFQMNFDNLMTFGDADNDIEMIQAAGCGVVMANGLPEVKAVANAQTDSNDDDGVATYLEHYFETLM